MKQFLLLAFTVLLCFNGISQKGRVFEKVKELKMAYMTRELNLTSEEAQKFWPVYYNYFNELKQAKFNAKADVLMLEENTLNVKKKYKVEFKMLLNSDERANKVFLTDKNFNALVRKEIQNRQRPLP